MALAEARRAQWEAELAKVTANYATGRIPVGVVVAASLDLVREGWGRARPALAAMLVLFPVSVAISVHLSPAARVVQGDPAALAWAVVAALLAALPSGVATRALLGAPRPWRLDGGLMTYTGIQAALTLAWDRLLLLGVGAEATTTPVALTPVTALTVIVGGVALALATLYWQLWPVGRAMGDPTMTARRSVEQMIGAVWGSVAASIILTGAAGFVLGMTSLAVAGAIKADEATSSIILAVGLTPAQILGLAVTAAVWRLRNRPGEGVAGVFD